MLQRRYVRALSASLRLSQSATSSKVTAAGKLGGAHHLRPFCTGNAGEAPVRPEGPVSLFEAKSPDKQSKDTQKAIRHASMLMAGGVGSAFLGIAPFSSPNLFMIGLLLAVVQVHLGYAFMQRIYWTQRRRYVLEIERVEDDAGVVKVAVKCDAGLTRRFALTDEAASGQQPSMADIISRGGTFMYVDLQHGSINRPQLLDELLESNRGIKDEEVTAESVMGESKEESLRIVQKFADLTREHLSKIPEKDNTTSPEQGLRQLEISAQRVGAGFMVGGLLTWMLGDWSASAAIRAAAENYKPQATLAPEGSNPAQMRNLQPRAA